MEGLFELWESKKYGDVAPAKVTLNGDEVGETWDSLTDFYKEGYEGEEKKFYELFGRKGGKYEYI